jgi:protoporphyrin/coproporphyrin ferrochelatase
VLFTAHSVPCRTVISAPQMGTGTPPDPPDPYPVEAKQTAGLVAERIPGLGEQDWFFAFQSQGMSGGPWLGPTVEDTLTALHEQGVRELIIQPIGFLCDHVEILYDIDIGFRDFAEKLGMTIRRPESLNDSRLLTLALADLARRALGHGA